MYLEIHRSLTRESKRLEQEAKKMNINRQTCEQGAYFKAYYVETDESLIYRMYCAWFCVQPKRIDHWEMSGIYKRIYRLHITIPNGVIL